jgi:hypothetical protein
MLSNVLEFALMSYKTAPGLPKYTGKYDAPTGPKPIAKDTGDVPRAIRANYNKKKAIAQFISVWTTEGADYYVPGAGEKPSSTFNPSTNWAKLQKGLKEIEAKPLKDFDYPVL